MTDLFTRESDMTEVAIASDAAWWIGEGSPDCIASEIVGPDAIADLVGVRLDHAAIARRAAAGIEPLTDRLALLAVLAVVRGATTTGEVADALRVTASGARRAVAMASSRGALHREGRQQLRVDPAWAPAVERTVAVELKLSDWRSGLEQARRYLVWSLAAWLILARPGSADAQREARAVGVGLATLLPDGRMRRWVAPRRSRRRVRAWSAIWVGEQVLTRAGFACGGPNGAAPAASHVL